MARRRYVVELSEEESRLLLEMTCKGEIRARKMRRALILLRADEGLTDREIMAAIGVSRPTVERIRKRFVLGGLDKALNDDPRPGQRRKLDGRGEAQLVALACSQPPAGHEHWTLRLLGNRLVELHVVDSISPETVRQVLKKTNSSPGARKCGAFPRPTPPS